MFGPKSLFASLVFIFSAGVLTCSAQTILDPSFETPNIPDNSFQYNATGSAWTFAGFQRSGIIDAAGAGFLTQPAPDGEQFALLQFASGTGGSFFQAITFTLAGTYQLAYLDAGRPADGTGAFGNLSYQVLLDATVIGTGSTTTAQAFTSRSIDFSVAAPGTYTLKFATVGAPAGDNTAFFDATSITSVPEPASGGIFLAVGAALCAYRRHRNAAK